MTDAGALLSQLQFAEAAIRTAADLVLQLQHLLLPDGCATHASLPLPLPAGHHAGAAYQQTGSTTSSAGSASCAAADGAGGSGRSGQTSSWAAVAAPRPTCHLGSGGGCVGGADAGGVDEAAALQLELAALQLQLGRREQEVRELKARQQQVLGGEQS